MAYYLFLDISPMSLPHIDVLITELPSLQLGSTLSPSETACLPLRLQSNAFLLTALAQCRYLLYIWRALKEACPLHVRSPSKFSSSSLHTISSLSRASETDNAFCIGVIGCGRMGSHIVRKLLQDPHITPDMVLVSTRQPERLQEFSSQGVSCRFDNTWVASKADVIFLCCLPSQIAPVLLDLSKSAISHAALLISVLVGVGASRIRRALNNRSNVMSVYFDWNELSVEDREELSQNNSCVTDRMSRHAMCVATTPFKLATAADTWYVELVLSCVSYCLNQAVVGSEVGGLVCSILANDATNAREIFPGVLYERQFISNYFESEKQNQVVLPKLACVLGKEKLRDILVEQYWQRIREVEPSLLDIAKTQTPTKSL